MSQKSSPVKSQVDTSQIQDVFDTNKPLDDTVVQIFINEYNLCNDRIETFLKRQDTILQISMAIVGGAIAYTLLNPIPAEFYLAIPMIPIILFLHISYHYIRVIANQGYREYIQEKLNNYLPRDSSLKYSQIGKRFLLNSNPVSKVNSAIFPGIILASIFYSIIMSNYNVLVIIGNFVITVLVTIISIRLIKFTINLNETVKNYCENN